MTIKGEKVNVKFDISFTVYKGAESVIESYQLEKGQNSLVNTDQIPLPSGDNARDNSTYRYVAISSSMNEKDFKVQNTTGEEYELSDEDKVKYVAQFIMHGIGHNIGMAHGEQSEGLMKRYPVARTLGLEVVDNFSGRKEIQYKIKTFDLSKSNVQNLINNVEGMSSMKGKVVTSMLKTSSHSFWQGKTEVNKDAADPEKGKVEALDNSGVSVTEESIKTNDKK